MRSRMYSLLGVGEQVAVHVLARDDFRRFGRA
jgi:hypothetical protein